MYLYCLNDPANRIDPAGEVYVDISTTSALQMGLRGYNMYTMYGSVKGYAKQFAAGASMRSILINAAFDVAFRLAADKAVGFAAKKAAHVIAGIVKKGKNHLHHVFPMFLGGAKKGIRYS